MDEYAEENATIAYNAYTESVGWSLPQFSELPERIQIAWAAAAQAVAVKVQMGM